jgi:unsaturated pyranuronate lyase
VSAFDRLEAVQPIQLWDGIVARSVRGDRMTFAVVDLGPDVSAPEHHHANEQLGLVLRGSVTMVVSGEARTLGPGDTYVIRSDVPHSAAAGPEGATVIDVFNPTREDWERLERLEPGPGRWP